MRSSQSCANGDGVSLTDSKLSLFQQKLSLGVTTVETNWDWDFSRRNGCDFLKMSRISWLSRQLISRFLETLRPIFWKCQEFLDCIYWHQNYDIKISWDVGTSFFKISRITRLLRAVEIEISQDVNTNFLKMLRISWLSVNTDIKIMLISRFLETWRPTFWKCW